MNRWLMAGMAGAVLGASFAFAADNPQKPTLQPYVGPIQYAQPLQICKVRLVNGQIVQVSPWIDYPSLFFPASGFPPSPCGDGGSIAFDNVEFVDGTLTIGENSKYGTSCNIGGGRWWFGPDYRNPLWVNDIQQMFPGTEGEQANALVPVWANTNTQGNTFIMAIFTAEDFDDTCSGPAADNIYDGVAYDFGTLGTGAWYSTICLSSAGLSHQLPTDGSGAYIGIYLSSLEPLTLYPEPCQPLLWGTKEGNPSQQGPIQWDDDNPTDGELTAPDECYDYTFPNDPICPRPLGAMMAFWAAPPTCVPSNGDVNQDGCVDDADLLAVLFAFGGTGEAGEDVNCDGIVDDADLLTVLFNFGQGC